MTRFVWRDGDWVEPAPRATHGLTIVRDLPGYLSPLGDGWVDGRAARREHLKANNCREVDPGEWKRNPAYAERKARLKAQGK
jgi:hypothetical protein